MPTKKDYLGAAFVCALSGVGYLLPYESKETIVPLYTPQGRISSQVNGDNVLYEVRKGHTQLFVTQEEFKRLIGKAPSALEENVDEDVVLR